MIIALVWTLLAASTVSGLLEIDRQETETKRLADDPNLEVAQSSANIAAKGTLSLDADNTDILPNAHNLQRELLPYIEERAVDIKKQLHRGTQSEERKREADAKHEHTIHLCQRDYKQPCPLGFKHIATSDGQHTCLPPQSYTGPCIGQELVYRFMPEEDKISWSINCLANWPCMRCRRRYSDICPEKWELDKHNTAGKLVCKASDEYQGPCKDDKISFIGYNIEMQKQWSQRCQAWWPCDSGTKHTVMPDADLPITLAATLYRITH
ncbi:uncharacterized protein BXIN_2276 [Babesia sp. Xinjiang]|uniref:uncharacterized protein n=1 Tax=Babesia sp. Xinjiang TaxID=462227 RepID=UPI000A2557DD|nr:uncharacterized protein BXIN_2276 [Babesia sp. Xinjiang]ORM40814.1 hypothetical protein BXIN_2276 [Babesia sp. Xinjiang]